MIRAKLLLAALAVALVGGDAPEKPKPILVAELNHTRLVLAVAYSPDGNTLAVSALRTVKLWDISELREKK
jgi:WD40 repeat protein